MTTPTLPALVAGMHRRLALLSSPLPLMFVEATPGAGTHTLLTQWARQPLSPELRVLIDAAKISGGGADILRVVDAAIASGEAGARGDVIDKDGCDETGGADTADETTQAAQAVLVHARALRRPIVVAVDNADFLSHEMFTALMYLVTRRGQGRVIAAGFDLSPFKDQARDRRIAFTVVDDRDLMLDRAEIRALVIDAGLAVGGTADQVAARIAERTRGLAALVRATIDYVQLHAGETSSPLASSMIDPGLVGAYLLTHEVASWPSMLVRFVTELVFVPRFTMPQASLISGIGASRVMVDRMVALGLGQVGFHPLLRQQVFAWFEPARQVTLAFLTEQESADLAEQERRYRRREEAARQTFDGPLLTATLVEMGRLAEAERYLRDFLWDCLPNTYDPLWNALSAVSPLMLVDYPRLLALRIRVERRRVQVPVGRAAGDSAMTLACERAAEMVVTDNSCGGAGTEPWARLGELALALGFARYRGDTAGMVPLIERARGLATDLLGGAFYGGVTTAACGDALLIADVAFQLGNHAVAAEFASYVLDMLESGSRRLDVWGERRALATRLCLVSARERGLPDPVDANVALAGPQFRWRDTDVAAQALAVAWGLVDDGDIAGADAACRDALGRVAEPERWPGLWHMRVWMLAVTRRSAELKIVLERYRASCQAVGISLDRSRPLPAVMERVMFLVGESVPLPSFLVPPDVADADWAALRPGGGLFARWVFDGLLLDALDAVREGRRQAARGSLEQAVEIVSRRRIGPTSLAVASAAEVRELAGVIGDHPDADLLRLDHAAGLAGRGAGAVVALSAREEDVLGLLREGLTNKQIAETLFVSANTVKFHRTNLMRKLGASSRQQTLEIAGRLGL